MNFLLDTHTLIWWSIDPIKLSQQAKNLLDDENNNLFLSIISVWEIQIKLQIGKLTLKVPLSELIKDQQETNDLQLLPIELTHIYALSNLPNHHRDPFDRLLIAQATVEQIPIVSIDSVFDNYPIQRLW
ncbi:type II toxin-antitoxin system VapC family toxin [Calothrix sp. FACHB-1219]|uniref:type II toxin-antitoxin system VapC family toxin n=1 Tax=unclassified Calothrix TaxID=2619626 RepID=UPI001684A5A4|nr:MULTISPECIES: type II toxin-antitoxin system VapC family toxin [unclassified Calothrix]MBD2201191.1 type II toxin-antitoxin system VapC family toxin [Calothrix sp. FACHB-168]MBD2215625.1 type II toxin-antitoxin system VapC family toxin [Calothrix sp. FACHB-1219]